MKISLKSNNRTVVVCNSIVCTWWWYVVYIGMEELKRRGAEELKSRRAAVKSSSERRLCLVTMDTERDKALLYPHQLLHALYCTRIYTTLLSHHTLIVITVIVIIINFIIHKKDLGTKSEKLIQRHPDLFYFPVSNNIYL